MKLNEIEEKKGNQKMRINQIIKVFVIVLILSLITIYACTSATYMEGSWTNPAFGGKKFNKIIVLAIHKDIITRSTMEKNIVSGFKDNKINSVSASDVIDFDKLEKGSDGKLTEKSKEYFMNALKENNVDAGLIIALKDIKDTEHYVPGTTQYIPRSGYSTFYGFYHTSYDVVQSPGYIEKSKQVYLVSNLYDVSTEELLWSAQSQTVNPTSLSDLAKSYSGSLVQELVSNGIIK